MADPLPKSLTADQWNLVASNVVSGSIHKLQGIPSQYLQTYRVVSLGNPDPVTEDQGVPMFLDHPIVEPIGHSEAINVFIWPKRKPGKVMVYV